jgi:hypothetical protein
MTLLLPVDVDRTRRAALISVALAAVLSALVASLARWGPDWPAQEFRAWVAGHDGLSVFTTRWYGGSPLPGYSVLYPLLAGVVGAGVVGVASCVAITWAATGLAPAGHVRSIVFGIAVAVCTTQNLLIGQVPFLMGTAFGVLAFRSVLAGRHPALIAVFALLASLSSPLAGGFVLLVAPAVAVHTGWRRTLPLAGAAAGSGVAAIVGGASGPFPCPWQTFVGVAAFCVAVVVFTGRYRTMRVFAFCYLLAAVGAFVEPNPIGGNIARLGKLIAVPLACYFLSTRNPWARLRTTLVAAAAFIWPAVAFTTSMTNGAIDPSRNQQFYSGLVSYLDGHPGTGRLEIPFTREHWESYFVARHFPIARGWERQSDLQYNSVLYHPLTASNYRSWLSENAIGLVALPRAPIDYGGKAEAALLKHPPRYLAPVWADAHWQVWRVVHPTPIVTGAGRLTDEDPSSLRLQFAVPGTAVVRIHASSLWLSDTAGSCVGATEQGWMLVRSDHPGPVVLRARLNATLLTGAQTCTP